MGRQTRTAWKVLCWTVVVTGLFLVSETSGTQHHVWKRRNISGSGGGSVAAGGGREGEGGKREAGEQSRHGGKEEMPEGRAGPGLSAGHRNVLLQEAVRRLLGFASSPEPGQGQGPALLPDPSRPPPMPKYVMDLYDKYRSGEMQESPTLGNTIRSIHAEIGEVNGEAMFIFNLSSIPPTERVLRANVHLYKRKSRDWKKRVRKRADTELILYEVAPHYLSQTGSILMQSPSKGWQWYGATDAVVSCLLADRKHPHLFALSFRTERANGKQRPVSLKKFVWHHSLPFLILYSNETDSVNLEELDIVAERMHSRQAGREDHRSNDLDDENDGDISDDSADEEDGMDGEDVKTREEARRHSKVSSQSSRKRSREEIGGENRRRKDQNKRSALPFARGGDEATQAPEDSSAAEVARRESGKPAEQSEEDEDHSPSARRSKRSILTNEIPENPQDYYKFPHPPRFNLPQTHPGMLTARREGRQRGAEEDRRLIPYPPTRSQSSKRRRRKHRGRKGHRGPDRKSGRRLLRPEEWEDYHGNVASADSSPGQVCARRRLVVDFADIGWGDWIISPKSFEAHYCAGTCPFPLTKKLRPSNHATIQSIVNAIGLYADVPAPCCVPDVMTSVTLLYFDENRNVVLKNYPGMSVQSCACR